MEYRYWIFVVEFLGLILDFYLVNFSIFSIFSIFSFFVLIGLDYPRSLRCIPFLGKERRLGPGI